MENIQIVWKQKMGWTCYVFNLRMRAFECCGTWRVELSSISISLFYISHASTIYYSQYCAFNVPKQCMHSNKRTTSFLLTTKSFQSLPTTIGNSINLPIPEQSNHKATSWAVSSGTKMKWRYRCVSECICQMMKRYFQWNRRERVYELNELFEKMYR